MNTVNHLILASTSRFRAEQLKRLSVDFAQIAPEVDEDIVKAEGLLPKALSRKLAQAKADAVLARYPERLVIGGDQVCALGDQVLDKPGNADRAVEQLLQMQGKPHQLLTSICVKGVGLNGERIDQLYTNTATLHMKPLTPAQIKRYVVAENPVDSCGAYMLENKGIALFDKIECDDYTAIIGMPLIFIAGVLEDAGYHVI